MHNGDQMHACECFARGPLWNTEIFLPYTYKCTYLPDDDGKQNDDWGEDDEGGYNGGP